MQNSAELNKALIRRMFHDVFGKDSFDKEALERYFSPKFIQHADGKTLDFDGLVDHVRELKRTVTGLRFQFEYMLAEGNQVMDVHRVEGEKRVGGKFTVRLFSLWLIDSGKIVLCDELSRLEQGEPEDRDLGSRTSRR
jgi:predicted SnoaL-like aldol condensation-catalyzing enzyme